MATERLKTPLLFPCAARVKMPQLGSDDADVKEGQKSSRLAPDSVVFQRSSRSPEPVSQQYLRRVSMDLSFAEDVVRERCFFALPYDEKYMYEAFDISGIVTLPPKSKYPVGRHNARGVDVRHMPCNLTKSTKSNLKPLKRKIIERARQMHIEALKREEKKEPLLKAKKALLDGVQEESEESSEPSVFLTETKIETKPKPVGKAPVRPKSEETKRPEKELTEKKLPVESKVKLEVKVPKAKTKSVISETLTEESEPEKKRNNWDSHLMSLLSQKTANWIVYERTTAGSEEREKLERLLRKWYGKPERTDLVFDEMSDSEDEEEKKEKLAPKKKWKKKEATLLERVYDLEEAPPHSLDPYSDDNQAPFYRQPAGLRRARKHDEKEELGAINTTAAEVEVKSYKPPPPPKLRDFMNPEIRERLYDTDNMFRQEQLTGTEQIYEIFGDQNKIVMATNNKYKKKLQEEFPKSPECWFPETEEEKLEHSRDRMKQSKRDRGHRRWKKLPEPIDDTAELLKVQPPGYETDGRKSTDLRTRKTAKSNSSLMQIKAEAIKLDFRSRLPSLQPDPIELLKKMLKLKMTDDIRNPFYILDEWRNKWHLSGQYADSSPDDLIKDMADIQPHVRLKAIATCGKAAEYKPPTDQGIKLNYLEKEEEMTEALPERLFVALECLLDDPVDKVRKAAAITLYSLSRPSKKAEGILYEALESDNPVDRWAAAQCLAHYGVCDSDVIGEILKQVMTTEDTIKHERGITMLGVLSITSNLVHSMVAERLNSSSWRHKVIACKILPTLRGDINKDITNKLSDLMWNDWHAEVRRSAAQCLGKTGHGRDVHDDLRTRIIEGNERIKLEAISKVGQLGLMTAKLLPAFLKCFEDEYVSVRSEVCITCGNLEIKDEEIIGKLIHLATFDTIWKVKALAFQALGKIGIINEEVIDCLLWAVRYEENPGVRAEACHTLKVLNVKTEEVAEVLQDRFLVESSPVVRDEIASALQMFNISATEDMDMVAQIKSEVRKLCTRNIIASQIQLNEADEDRRENLTRMIYESEKEMKENEPEQEPVLERLRSLSRAESRKSKRTASGASTPEPVREGAFTPTADQELEAILAKEEAKSGATSPSGSTPGTTPAKSEGEVEEDGEKSEGTTKKEEEGGEEEESHEPVTPGETPGTDITTPGSQTPARDTETEEEETELSKSTDKGKSEELGKKSEVERPTSVVKFASHLEVADIPLRSTTPLSSRMSLMEDGTVKHSRMSTATVGGDTMVFGKDAVIEREKINNEARNTFAVMDARYQDMVNDLIELDNAFELGLMNGSREDFEKRIQNVRITKTPPKTAQELPRIELTINEVIPELNVEKAKEVETMKDLDTKLDSASSERKSAGNLSKIDNLDQRSQEKSAGTKGKTDDDNKVVNEKTELNVTESDRKVGQSES